MLHVITGPMFSSKTTRLLSHARINTIAGRGVLLVKHSIDDRFSEQKITTHDGIQTMAELRTDDPTTILEAIGGPRRGPDVVCIDEIQFFAPSIVEVIDTLAWGRQVFVAGLDMDINAKPFPVTAALLARADVVKKCKAVCTHPLDGKPCGEDAGHTVILKRLPKENGPHVEVGGAELYQPRCRRCFHATSGS